MRLRYCHAMVKRADDGSRLPLQDVSVDGLPDHILEILKNHPAFSKSASFGRKGIGSPEEYEKLEVSDDAGVREFVYHNKGMHFMMEGKEVDRPVFQVFVHFMSQVKAQPNE